MPSTLTAPTLFGATTPFDPDAPQTVRSSLANSNLFITSAKAAAGSFFLEGQATPSSGGSSGGQSNSAFQRRAGTTATGFYQATKLCDAGTGFSCSISFKIPTTIGDRRLWVGVGSSAPTDSDTAAGHYLGLRYSLPAADAGFIPVSRDGTTQTVGTAFAMPVVDIAYVLFVTVLPGATTATIALTRLDTNVTETTTVSANLPLSGTLCGWICYGHNQGVSKAIELSTALTSTTIT